MRRYKRIEPGIFGYVGSGTFGEVFKARDRETEEVVALKRIRLEREDNGVPCTALREVSLLKALKHPNIITLRDFIFDNSTDECEDCQLEGSGTPCSNCLALQESTNTIRQSRLYLVFELMDCDLKSYMDSCNGPMDILLVKSLLLQALEGLEYCHARGIMHRDMKPQNLLVSRDGTLKLCDFGLARAITPPTRRLTHEVVTLWYRAPEILLGSDFYAPPVDVWACGPILIEMAAKHPLFPGDSEVDQLFRIFRLLGTPNETTWPGVTQHPEWNERFPKWPRKCFKRLFEKWIGAQGVDLLEKILVYNPNKRIPALQAMAHPFFHELTQAPPQQNEPTHALHRNSEDDNNTPQRDSEDDDGKEN